jgi:hypothetical protein
LEDLTMSDRKAVYTVRERKEGAKPFWCRIGTCFTNKDGSFSIVLDALPIDGRLVVREEQQREDRDDPPPRRPARAASPAPDFQGGSDDIPF